MILAVSLLVAVLLATNWYYYRLTRRSFNDDFTLRLETLASIASLDLEGTPLLERDSTEARPGEPDSLTARLAALGARYSLSNVLVVREDGVTLLSLQADLYRPGELYPNWNMDYPAIIEALEGSPAATDLYRAPDGTCLKAGYAPLPLHARGARAVVAVEASADLLGALERLRTVLVAATGISIAGVALFTWFVLKATSSLIRARESLMRSETLTSMGRMAAGIAHEIRNPLLIIRGAAENLKRQIPERAGDLDTFIIEEVDRLNGILTDYLLFARDEQTRRDAVDLVTTLKRSVRLVADSLRRGGIELIERYGLEEAPFIGEEKKLQQTFLNILLNAEQAMSGGGTLTVSIERRDDRYRIAFADTGTGIPAREIEKVFEPFYTTKPAGSGLGLAVVRRIVEDHGGTVAIASDPSSGTTVTVTVPTEGARRETA
jgi:signal transduction histidine kinase